MAFLTIYGQNFDDYFEIEEKTETSPIYKTTTTLPTTSPTSTTTPTSPTSTTSSMPTPTSPTLLTSTNSSMPTTTPTSPTSTTSSMPTTTDPTCTCDEKINPNLINLVKEMIVSICEKKIDTTTTRTTTEATTTTTNKMDRFLEEDVFSEFEDIIKPSHPGKRSKTINEDWRQMLIISISSAAAGTTVLLMVTLFLCLKKGNRLVTGEELNETTGTNLELERTNAHIYDEVGPRRMAVPEDVSFIDEEEEVNKAPTDTERDGFIGVKGFPSI